ncbi:MAG TPA: hypothetical protein VG095_10595 [Chthoniobacterales bacterium]|nr:hypothetical protein [Chthoniobacterales bacterium]
MRRILLTLVCASLLPAGALPQVPPLNPEEPVVRERPYGPIPPPTAPPQRKKKSEFEEQKRPIPKGWVWTGIGAGVLALGALVYGALRNWRSSGLFEREYRFPLGDRSKARFGAERNGGHMAVVKFGAD